MPPWRSRHALICVEVPVEELSQSLRIERLDPSRSANTIDAVIRSPLAGWRSAEHTPCRIVPGRDCLLHSFNLVCMEVSITPNLGRLTRSPSRGCENGCPTSGQTEQLAKDGAQWPRSATRFVANAAAERTTRSSKAASFPASGRPDRLQPIGDPWGRCPLRGEGGPMIARSPSRRSTVDAGSACTSSFGGST